MKGRWGKGQGCGGNESRYIRQVQISYIIMNRTGEGPTWGTKNVKGEEGRDPDVRDPRLRSTRSLPPSQTSVGRTATTSDQPRPKLKLPNLFDNLALMEPEPVTDAIDTEPGASPAKCAFELGGDCDKCESLSGRDATPLNPCLTKWARCL